MRWRARIQGMSPGRIPRLAGIAALLALLATACAGVGDGGARAGSPSAGSPTGNGSAPGGSPPPTAQSGAVPEILRFTAPILGGGELRGEDLVRQDVAMWFWAPW